MQSTAKMFLQAAKGNESGRWRYQFRQRAKLRHLTCVVDASPIFFLLEAIRPSPSRLGEDVHINIIACELASWLLQIFWLTLASSNILAFLSALFGRPPLILCSANPSRKIVTARAANE